VLLRVMTCKPQFKHELGTLGIREMFRPVHATVAPGQPMCVCDQRLPTVVVLPSYRLVCVIHSRLGGRPLVITVTLVDSAVVSARWC